MITQITLRRADRAHQPIHRWGNSLAVRLPVYCLRRAGLREGDQVVIVVGEDGRLSLEPLHQLDRASERR